MGIRILEEKDSELARKWFIEAFVDTQNNYYCEWIEKTISCSDGLCYRGYLWDCLKTKQVISEKAALCVIHDVPGEIYVMWDIHSKDYIWIPDYWKYPKNAVLQMEPSDFENTMDTFPEDVYVFDLSFTWVIVLTHEESRPGRRFCLECRIS